MDIETREPLISPCAKTSFATAYGNIIPVSCHSPCHEEEDITGCPGLHFASQIMARVD